MGLLQAFGIDVEGLGRAGFRGGFGDRILDGSPQTQSPKPKGPLPHSG